MNEQRLNRFMSYVFKHTEANGGCWVWTGFLNPNGYGRFRNGGAKEQAHKVSFEHFKGPIPEGKFCLHKCNNRNCVNPDHLYVGTLSENTLDSVRAGTHKGQILSVEQVKEIKRRLLLGEKVRNLADEFGVNKRTVSCINTGASWGHVENETLKDFAL